MFTLAVMSGCVHLLEPEERMVSAHPAPRSSGGVGAPATTSPSPRAGAERSTPAEYPVATRPALPDPPFFWGPECPPGWPGDPAPKDHVEAMCVRGRIDELRVEEVLNLLPRPYRHAELVLMGSSSWGLDGRVLSGVEGEPLQFEAWVGQCRSPVMEVEVVCRCDLVARPDEVELREFDSAFSHDRLTKNDKSHGDVWLEVRNVDGLPGTLAYHPPTFTLATGQAAFVYRLVGSTCSSNWTKVNVRGPMPVANDDHAQEL